MDITRNEFNFVQAKLLPIFDCSKQFNFDFVKCHPEEGYAFLASLFQHPSVGNASSVHAKFYDSEYDYNSPGAQLPIEEISNWLHRPCATITAAEIISKIMEKRTLNVAFYKIGNILEMIKHLKKVEETRGFFI